MNFIRKLIKFQKHINAKCKCGFCKSCITNCLKKNFTNWTSGNEKIDDFIQKLQLEISKPNEPVFEWIPYNQFDNINEISRNDYATVYSAIWKDGPLYYDYEMGYSRKSDKKVALKCLHNSQNIPSEFLNEV